MEKHLIVLDDGTEIFSGMQEENVICRVELTEKVNEGENLKPGAVCPTALEAELLTPGGKLHIPVGSDLILYKVNDEGAREQVGLFTVANAMRPSPNRYLITAYDRLSRLDKDLTEWVDNLDGWPYRMQTFAQMVCDACDLYLRPGYFSNGEWPVHRFTVVNVTGRKLMQWIGELACRFSRATPDGEIILDWYTQTEGPFFDEYEKFAFLDSLSCADYVTDVIDKVVIRVDNQDRGVAYGTGSNVYVITGNRLVADLPKATLEGLAQAVYRLVCQVQYTPCKIAVSPDVHARCGDILYIRGRNFREICMYVMKKTQRGQKNILECVGSPCRGNQL